MMLRCTNCHFELNLSKKSIPANARLFCPKCKNELKPIEEENISEQSESKVEKTPFADNNQNIPPSLNASPVESNPMTQVETANNLLSKNTLHQQSELFSEDIKPELEVAQSNEEIFKKREDLFSKPEQVWYDTTVKPPPLQTPVPPPIPVTATPPPIPTNIPPPIPPVNQQIKSGYISASSSIQIDSSLVMPETQPQKTTTPPIPMPQEEKIELAINPSEIQSTPQTYEPIKEELDKTAQPEKAHTADKKDVIILTPQTYPTKKISITIPAISLIALACIAGFIYYQIVISSSKTDFIKDLKSTPALGAIPAIQNKEASQKTQDAEENKSTLASSPKKATSSIPIKAKKSALEHYKKGNQYYMQSKYEQARDEYAMAIAADPTFGLAYRGLGTTYAKLGQPDLAVKNYEKYIEVMPNASDAEQVKAIIKQYYGK